MTDVNVGDFERSLRMLSETIREQSTTGERLAEALGRVYEAIAGLKTGDAETRTLLGVVKDKIEDIRVLLADNTRDHREISEKLAVIHTFIVRYEEDHGPDGIKEAVREVFLETADDRKEFFKSGLRDVLVEPGTGLVMQQHMRAALVVPEDEKPEHKPDEPKGMLPFFKILVIGAVITFLALVWAIVMREKPGGSFQVDKNGVKIEAGTVKPQEPK
jgi:hypothetical protein